MSQLAPLRPEQTRPVWKAVLAITAICFITGGFLLSYALNGGSSSLSPSSYALSATFKAKALAAFEDTTKYDTFLDVSTLQQLTANDSDRRLLADLREYSRVSSDLHSARANLYMTEDLKKRANDLYEQQSVLQYRLDEIFKANGLLSERQALIEDAMKPSNSAVSATKTHNRK